MAAKAGKKGLRRAMIFAEICLISWRSGRRAAAHGRHTCQSCHLWLEVALRDLTVDRRTGAVERHGRIEYRVNALEFAARVVHALTQRLATEFVRLFSAARPGRHRIRQRAGRVVRVLVERGRDEGRSRWECIGAQGVTRWHCRPRPYAQLRHQQLLAKVRPRRALAHGVSAHRPGVRQPAAGTRQRLHLRLDLRSLADDALAVAASARAL